MCFKCDVICTTPFKGGVCWILEAVPLRNTSYRTRCWLPSPQPCWTRTSVRKRQRTATLMMSLCRQCLCWHLLGLSRACHPLLPLEPSFSCNKHTFFSHSAMLTTEVDKINHPKSRNLEMPSDFSCCLSSEWPPPPQDYASKFICQSLQLVGLWGRGTSFLQERG